MQLQNPRKSFFKVARAIRILAVSGAAIGCAAAISAPANAASLSNGSIAFNAVTNNFFTDVNPGAGDTVTINFSPPIDVSSADGPFKTLGFFPSPNNYPIVSNPSAVLNYVSGDPSGFVYSLNSPLAFNFTNGISLNIGAGSTFSGSFNVPGGVRFEITNHGIGSNFGNTIAGDTTIPSGLNFTLTALDGAGTGGATVLATTSAVATPEPFTIIGTLIGGTAALRMRKKLASAKK
jgi:hypothetical protein